MLQNAYFLAKIGADTAENEQHFAEILPKTGNYPTSPPPGAASAAGHAAPAAPELAPAGRAPRPRVATRAAPGDDRSVIIRLPAAVKIMKFKCLVLGSTKADCLQPRSSTR